MDAEAGAGSEDRRLPGRVAVIADIGGAIGGAVATRFAREGATVVGIDRVPLGIEGPLYLADLTDRDRLASTLAAAVQLVLSPQPAQRFRTDLRL